MRSGKAKRDARAADALVVEAGALAASGRTADAEGLLRQAVEADPTWVEPKRALVQLLSETGNEPGAIQFAAHALAQHPGDHDLLIAAAIAHERMGALAEAAEELALVLADDTNHLLANQRLAPLLDRVGDRLGAMRCLRRIVTITGGQDLEAMHALGIRLSGAGEHGEAIELLTEVVRRRPDAASVRADLAMALLSAGQIDEALAEFTALLRLDPRSAQAHCGIGLVYQQLERWGEAADAFRATEALAPDQPIAPFNLGLVLAAAGDRDGARRALLRAAALAPDDAEIRAALQSSLMPQQPPQLQVVPPPQPPAAPQPPPRSPAAPQPPPRSPVARAPVTTIEPAPATTRFAGDLKSFALPDVLEFLRVQKKTGALVLSSRKGAGLIRLAGGEITSASAPGVLRLGEALVARGLVTLDELQAALTRQAGGEENGEALGTMLMRNRPADEEQLTRAVFAQVLAAVDEMLGWREGEFSFHPARDAAVAAISFDLRNVMLEIVRLADEREHNAVRR